MAKAWEELENKCFEHVKSSFGHAAVIEAYGKADSTKADIRVAAPSGDFFVEVKAKSSQCCQFVLFPDDETGSFEFSDRNKVPLTPSCQKIIDHMNQNYDKYSRVGKKPIPINVESSVFYGLVDEFYSAKNVKCFMTEGEEIMIFPAAKFPEYFEIAGFYRRKNSGSSEPNEAKNHAEIIQGLADYGIEGDVVYQSVSGKIRCLLHTDAKLDGQRMMCDEYTYQFKDNPHSQKVTKQKQHVFEVRRLSNTSNPNVICQLTLKKHQQDKDDLAAFEALLK